jgi:hypothetical protein
VKITLVNNTVAEIPLTSRVPNLGRRATQEVELTAIEFEALKPLLDSLKTKGIISYTVHSDLVSPVSPRNALTMTSPGVEKLQSSLDASKDSVAALFSRVSTLDDALASQVVVTQLLAEKLVDCEKTLLHLQTTPPQPMAFRADAQNAVSQSHQTYAPVNGLQLVIPSSGRWLVLGEIGLYSPVSSKGKICLGRFGGGFADTILEGSERSWVRTQEDSTSVFTTACLSLEAGDIVAIYWKATEGALRATYRSLTLLRS